MGAEIEERRPQSDGTATCARRLLLAALRGENLPGPVLAVLDGPAAGRSLPLRSGILGRGRSADLTLPDPTLSRRHLRVVVDGTGVRVEDLGSRNGTRVDGRAWTGLRLLEPGAVLGRGVPHLLAAVA